MVFRYTICRRHKKGEGKDLFAAIRGRRCLPPLRPERVLRNGDYSWPASLSPFGFTRSQIFATFSSSQTKLS